MSDSIADTGREAHVHVLLPRRSFAIFAALPSKRITFGAILVAEVAILCLLAFCGKSVPAGGLVVRPGGASIEVADQTGPWGVLVVKKVVAPAPSWVVVQAGRGAGGAGVVLGFTRVPAGTSADVSVALDPRQSSADTLVVSLLADRGKVGVFEFTPSSSGGGAGMGMGGQSSQGGAGSASAGSSVDAPLIVEGKRISAVLGETFRSGTPGVVHRVVEP